MKLVCYRTEDAARNIGVLSRDDEWVFPLKAVGTDYEEMQTLIAENKWGTVNEEKFIDVFSRVSGEDLSDYIKSYL